ncbi:hypothetical protein D7147_13580 [Micromonospora musae]|uniref:Uncharacterized protein n=1 Tax=Micromonospora musae TaxID=1894970 RepID=A0ABX9RBI4_9ACTN|nr:hypothetical protein [Micromonospora musae]RKN19943.1 hypothetical protein D7147_13580 [Micromonospora musae]
MTGDVARQRSTHEAGFRRWSTWWQVLRVVLLVLWICWAASSWWSAPRQASTARARADLSAGRMVSYQWAAGWDNTADWSWAEDRGLWLSGRAGPLFVWRTGDWRVHYAEFDRDFTGPTEPGSFDATQYSGAEAAAFDQLLQSAELDRRWQGMDSPPPLGNLAALLMLGLLTVLVLGPAPARGTRWFWFWVLTGVPFGLGLIWWLGRERPWHPAEPAPPTAVGRDPRDRWYAGLLIGIATSIAASLLLYGLRQVFGEWYVPHDAGS